jgi:hypothetical protein
MRTALDTFQTKGNAEKVRIKFNNSVSTTRISLMKTKGILLKIVKLKVLKPHHTSPYERMIRNMTQIFVGLRA